MPTKNQHAVPTKNQHQISITGLRYAQISHVAKQHRVPMSRLVEALILDAIEGVDLHASALLTGDRLCVQNAAHGPVVAGGRCQACWDGKLENDAQGYARRAAERLGLRVPIPASPELRDLVRDHATRHGGTIERHFEAAVLRAIAAFASGEQPAGSACVLCSCVGTLRIATLDERRVWICASCDEQTPRQTTRAFGGRP